MNKVESQVSEINQAATRVARAIGFADHHAQMEYDGVRPDLDKRLSGLRNRSILLSGSLGVGKTGYLAVKLKQAFTEVCQKIPEISPALLAIEFRLQVFMRTHEEIKNFYQAQFSEGDLPFSHDDLRHSKILIIDDLGLPADSNHTIDHLADLIDFRWSRNMTTWMTSNISMEDFQRRPGWERIVARLKDKSWLEYIEIGGKNRRE